MQKMQKESGWQPPWIWFAEIIFFVHGHFPFFYYTIFILKCLILSLDNIGIFLYNKDIVKINSSGTAELKEAKSKTYEEEENSYE